MHYTQRARSNSEIGLSQPPSPQRSSWQSSRQSRTDVRIIRRECGTIAAHPAEASHLETEFTMRGVIVALGVMWFVERAFRVTIFGGWLG